MNKVKGKTVCSFCGKTVKKKYGLDLLGRVYCKRRVCKLSTWYNNKVSMRVQRLINAW